MPAISRQLIRLRVACYTRSTAQLTSRHWQWFALALLLAPAGIPIGALLRALAYPLDALFAAGHGLSWYFVYLLTTQALALAWVLPQRRPILGGAFMRYADALPIPRSARLAADLALLLLADSLLLGLLANGIVVSAFARAEPTALGIVSLLALLVLTLGFQLTALDRRWARLPLLALADSLFAVSLSTPSSHHAWAALGAALATGLAALRLRGHPSSAMRRTGTQRASGIRAWLPSFVGIQYDILKARPGATSLRLGLAAILAAATVRAGFFFEYDGRVLPLTILALAGIALVLSGFYRTLRAAHAPMHAYLAALPTGRRYWPLRDMLFVLILGTAPLIPLLPPLGRHFPATAWAGLALAYLSLLAALRLPLAIAGRQTALAALLLAGIWSGIAMAAVAR